MFSFCGASCLEFSLARLFLLGGIRAFNPALQEQGPPKAVQRPMQATSFLCHQSCLEALPQSPLNRAQQPGFKLLNNVFTKRNLERNVQNEITVVRGQRESATLAGALFPYGSFSAKANIVADMTCLGSARVPFSSHGPWEDSSQLVESTGILPNFAWLSRSQRTQSFDQCWSVPQSDSLEALLAW